MKRCSYCGKEYGDETEVCLIDGKPLGDEPPRIPLQGSPRLWKAVFGGVCCALVGGVLMWQPRGFTRNLGQFIVALGTTWIVCTIAETKKPSEHKLLSGTKRTISAVLALLILFVMPFFYNRGVGTTGKIFSACGFMVAMGFFAYAVARRDRRPSSGGGMMSNRAQDSAAALLKVFSMFNLTPVQAIKLEGRAHLVEVFGVSKDAVPAGLQYLLENDLILRDSKGELHLTDAGFQRMKETVA